MAVVYAVVYGAEWEDIDYFTDEARARLVLIAQTSAAGNGFHPLMLEMRPDGKGMLLAARTWAITSGDGDVVEVR